MDPFENLLQSLQKADELKAQLDGFRPLPPDTEARAMQKLRLDWNYHSNHIEGGQLTYGETKALILHGLTAQGKPLKDHLETSGHDEAVHWIADVVQNERPLNETFIRQLHELVLKNPYRNAALTPSGEKPTNRINIGVYKTMPNYIKTITDEIIYFASPEETPAKMGDLMLWYAAEKAKQETHPILFAAQFHYKFIRIHPFDDGNGRMARLLMNFILMQHGFPPAVIKTEEKNGYLSALQQADAGMHEPFAAFIAKNAIASLETMLKAARGESIEDPDDLDKQIALLANKMKGAGEKIEKFKSEEVLMEWAEKILPFIAGKFIDINEKFKGIYVKREYGISLKSLLGWKNIEETFSLAELDLAMVNLVPLLIEEKCLLLDCYHDSFNRTEIKSPGYSFKIEIRFETTKYFVEGNESGQTFSKFYHQEPSEEELGLLLKKESEAHLAFIERAINDVKKEEDDGLPF